MNYAFAKAKADELRAMLAPACERIEIAGSVRRLKPDGIHDIEIVCISKPPKVEFGKSYSDLPKLHKLLDDLRQSEVIDDRRDKNGRPAWGEKYRRILWGEIPVDIFITTPGQWGTIFAIRTGGAEFSHALVTPRTFGGLCPPLYRVVSGYVCHVDEQLDMPEEIDLLMAFGIGWIEPEARTAQAVVDIRRAWGQP